MLNINNLHFRLTQNSHYILALMLLSLHAFLALNHGAYEANRGFFLCSYGLFLLWQPIWRDSGKLSLASIVIFLSFAGLFYSFVNWWMIAIWLCLLFGLLGGRVLSEGAKPNQTIHILAASYLLAMLLLWVVPKLLKVTDDLEATNFAITYLIPILPAAIFFLGSKKNVSSQAPFIDFFYTLIITLLAMIMVLASYVVGSQNQVNYLQVMLLTIFAIALTLIVVSYLWKPSTRFSGIELLMSRYLSSVGMPFEKWVANISNFAGLESSASDFLKSAMHEITTLAWVSGVTWSADGDKGEVGEQSKFNNQFSFKGLQIVWHSRWQISPALYVHINLLTQIVGEFYEAKRREKILRQNAYMQAFYESGSRLTHDIKNILQSLGALVKAAEQTKEQDNEKVLALVRRQLPMLNQRIAATLDKLKKPSEDKKRIEQIEAWWRALKLRHQHANITFNANLSPAIDINAEALDSIIDNLISNAAEKIKHEPNVQVTVALHQPPNSDFCIDVTDTGSAIPNSVMSDLFKKHISSQNGMGVGLYHAALDAAQAGYILDVVDNQPNLVRFRLYLQTK